MAVHVEVIMGQSDNPDEAISGAMQGLQNRWRLSEEKFEKILGFSTFVVDNRPIGGPYNLMVSIMIEEPKIIPASLATPMNVPVRRG